MASLGSLSSRLGADPREGALGFCESLQARGGRTCGCRAHSCVTSLTPLPVSGPRLPQLAASVTSKRRWGWRGVFGEDYLYLSALEATLAVHTLLTPSVPPCRSHGTAYPFSGEPQQVQRGQMTSPRTHSPWGKAMGSRR